MIRQNEIYFSLHSTSVVNTSAILTHCDVSSSLTKSQKPTPWRYKAPASAIDSCFLCVNVVDSQRGLYYKLNWVAHWQRSLERAKGHDIEWGSGDLWVVVVKPVLKKCGMKSSERVKEDADSGSGTNSDGEYKDESATEPSSMDISLFPDNADSTGMPQTPSKKCKQPTSMASTPRRKRVAPALAALTPHSKCALRAHARRPTLRAPPPEMAGVLSSGKASKEKDPWLRAMHALHVGAQPDSLFCLTEENVQVMCAVQELIEEGSSGCICKLFNVLVVSTIKW